MNEDQKNLWEKIRNYNLDDLNSSLPFSKRLMRENGWTETHTFRVMEEYKKFMFLCAESGHQVTPSDAVDQVWHLHLIYTYSYWKEFCGEILGKEIHHGPTKGGKQEGDKFIDWYEKTKVSYQLFFDEAAPTDIWPDSQKRFARTDFKRINLQENWLIAKPQNIFKKQYLFSFAFFATLLFSIPIASDLALFSPVLVVILALFGAGGLIYFVANYEKSAQKRKKIAKSKKKGNAGSSGSGGMIVGGEGGCSSGDSSGSSSSSFGGGDFGGGGAESGCGSSCGGGCGGGCGS